MAARLTTEAKVKARKFYIEYGFTNLTELQKLIGIPRQTLAALRDSEGWDVQRNNVVITPQELAQELTKIIAEILEEIKEKRSHKKLVAPSVHKDLVFYTKALRMIDEQYDIKGSLIIWSRKFIEHVAHLPHGSFADKKVFIETLQKIFPGFIAQVENG